MADDGKVRRENSPDMGGAGGVAAPAPGESSASNTRPLSSAFDAPTMLNIPASGQLTQAGTGSDATSFGQDSWLGAAPIGAELAPGTIVGNRYEIQQMLGIGGMGAVYKAKDLEIGRLVALKVIRPEFARDPAIIDRFKQELLLASQVTHKNVIRIFDLGEAEGMKFITMEYIDGRDLSAILRERGKFTPPEATAIIRQVCLALDAAQAVGVVHRDLKPQNILMEASGRVLVMDFGLARTLEDNGMTQSGSLVGTMDYMSPEQALGKSVDQRSDIFATGIIYYELLSGHNPYQAGTAVARLILRTQEPVVPLSSLDATIVKPLCEILCRSLERDVERRYQSAAEMIADLDAMDGGAPLSRIAPLPSVPIWRRLSWKVALPAVVVVLLLGTGIAFRNGMVAGSLTASSVPGASTLSLAVFPLRNASGDASLDWMSTSLADMLSTAVGQTDHLRTVSPERLRQVYSDLRLTPASTIDPAMLKRISTITVADTVVSGQYVKLGDRINIEVAVQDIKSGQVTTLKAQAAEKDLPAAISDLAESVRKGLSLSSADLKAARARSFEVTSTSAVALRNYNEAAALARTGQNIEAQKLLTVAVQEDAQFSQAFALLAQVQSNLGYQAEAQQSSRRAIELAETQKISSVAKDLINASHSRIIESNKKAIDEYEVLFRNLPGDSDVQYTLASLYIDTSAYDKARTLTTALLKDDPKSVRALWQMGVIEIISNNAQAALDPLNQALSLTIQTNNLEMKALVELALGISYRLLNKPDDAMRNYQDSILINQKIGMKRGVSAALDEMAQVQQTAGDSDAALVSYNKSLQLQREIGMNKEIGDTLINMGSLQLDRGQLDQALQTYQEALRTQRENGDENREALCLTNIAIVYLARGDTGNAFTYYQQALQLREKLGVPGFLADTLSGMGEAYTQDGQYDEATKTLIRALDLYRKADDKHGAALVSRKMGEVFADQGRFGAAVASMQESLKGLQALGEKGRDLVETQNDLASALARSGRQAEALAALAGADAAARDLHSDALSASLLNTRGDIELYGGNPSAAAQQYQKALQLVGRGKDQGIIALARMNLARTALVLGHARDTVSALSPLIAKRASFEKRLVIRISSTFSEGLIQTQALPRARQTLLSNLGEAEKAGMKPEIGRIYYLLATIARAGNNSGDAASYGRQAVKAFDAIRADQGGDKVLQRADIAQMYRASSQMATPGKP